MNNNNKPIEDELKIDWIEINDNDWKLFEVNESDWTFEVNESDWLII